MFSKVTRKPFRQSGLRKSINIEEASLEEKSATTTTTTATATTRLADDENEDTGNVVVRGFLSRADSTKQKKRKSSSRLSFGVRAEEEGEDGVGGGARTPEAVTPKRKGDGGLKKAIALRDLAMRSREEEDRPRYSKEYLQELQSSTPNTPKDTSRSSATEDEDMHMDLSELEGAVVVDSAELIGRTAATDESSATRILTDAEIREKKERRARLRQEAEAEFISLEDDEEPFTMRKEKEATRLVREDENLYEGFEEFVDDGGVALGRKAEREARRRKRMEMASLIQEAEGNSEEESEESDAERRAAFEAAQSRAGMDGLRRPTQKPSDLIVKPKITPLPTMSECLANLQNSLQLMERELAAKSKEVADLKREKEEIGQREVEVQRLLDEAGEKYRAAVAGVGRVTDSPARQILPGEVLSEFAAERGLESFGTPTRKNGDMDKDMATP